MSPIEALTVGAFGPLLRTLCELLAKGAAHARENGISEASLADARLAPDMYPLALQVRFACYHAEACVAQLSGQEPPELERGALPYGELAPMIERAIANIAKADVAAIEQGLVRSITIPLQPPLVLHTDGAQSLSRWSLPNFYFHLVTAYDILRHHGVVIGKRDFMSHIGEFIRPQPVAPA